MAKPEKTKKVRSTAEDAERQKMIERVAKLYQFQKEIDPHVSLSGIADECGIDMLKVRKMLITAGVYENEMSRKISVLWKEGKTTREIQECTGLSAASVHSYLPYSRIVYGREQPVTQEQETLPKKAQKKGGVLVQKIALMQQDLEWEKVPAELDQLLWDALLLYQDKPFSTAKNLEFTYVIKGCEMFVSRKDKSITKATVLVAFHKAMELQRGGKGISGPKKLGTFGASYLFPIFVELGVIEFEKK